MEENNKFKIKYKFDPAYSPTYVNGVYGGVSSRGELVAHFYLERWPLPKSQTFNISPESAGAEIVEERTPPDLSNSAIRMVDVGIIMEREMAIMFHNWLTNTLFPSEKGEVTTEETAF
jgi:hypothetical protein